MEECIITSTQNARIKHVVALQQKSSLRREEGLFVVEGQREIEHCMECGYEIVELFTVDGLRFTDDGLSSCVPTVASGKAERTDDYTKGQKKPYIVSSQVYEKMAYRGSTEGIIAVAKVKDHRLFSFLAPPSSLLERPSSLLNKPNPFIVVLESVEKPGNLGAILRSADAANVDAVIVCDPLTDLYNPNLIRASIGAIFTVPVAVCTSQECIAFLKERKIKILTAQLQDSYD